ncbi:MAG: hypothetical protein IBX55_09650 [Methyloprofundus sp.]|nr:hypothetical protein [Methyloprofundus sp.]
MKDNKETKEELVTPTQGVNVKRRSFAKAGIAAPVIMTLASRPVLGAQCLSNMMSGNLSDPNRGNYCWGGMSPGFWKTPAGAPDYTTADGQQWEYAWSQAGYSYYTGLKPGKNGNKWDDYTGGTPFTVANFFFAEHDPRVFATGANGKYTCDDDKDGTISVREALNCVPNDAGILHLIAGWLNIQYFSASNVPYFLTEAQFIEMYASDPGQLISLISANYHNNPN